MNEEEEADGDEEERDEKEEKQDTGELPREEQALLLLLSSSSSREHIPSPSGMTTPHAADAVIRILLSTVRRGGKDLEVDEQGEEKES